MDYRCEPSALSPLKYLIILARAKVNVMSSHLKGRAQCRKTKADTLKQLRPIGEGDQELDKRLVEEELIQTVTHMYRKSMQVNSLYSYPYLN
jgi:hypothetical protein